MCTASVFKTLSFIIILLVLNIKKRLPLPGFMCCMTLPSAIIIYLLPVFFKSWQSSNRRLSLPISMLKLHNHPAKNNAAQDNAIAVLNKEKDLHLKLLPDTLLSCKCLDKGAAAARNINKRGTIIKNKGKFMAALFKRPVSSPAWLTIIL